ncbi:general transcription factor IIH subunit 4 isoform X2 [Procambarus clarkii]|uniref:general transcription factor IIH subunit 4 isoform X2 n=1 Tax=Procambarus clarkii TaxID=6728 RepID=UPI003744A847
MMAFGTQTLTCKNLQEYLRSLAKDTLDRLYRHPATCLAVYRELPELSRQFVLRLLFVVKPVPQMLLATWIPQHEPGRELGDIAAEHRQGTQVLLDMYIWQEVKDHQGNMAIKLNNTFRENLKVAVLGGGKPWTMSAALDSDPHQRDVEFLDKYAMDRWESVLQFLVQPGQGQTAISRDAMRTLLHAGLIESDESDNMQITSSGFQFLLLDTASQVWFFILKYLETVTERGLSLVSCLTFLFKLSFSTLGKDYSMEGMDNELLTFLQHLREFGLVYLRKRSSGRFYPTRLALNITAGQNKGIIDVPKHGYLVIETNYRIYAYTVSELQIALLSIFTDIEGRFPNMVVASISRGSVRRALLKGIGAEQIISFLRQHCHPQMFKNNPVVPRTVADQIKLWELERERLEFSEGVLYKDFMSVHDFLLLSNYASSKGVLIYSDEKQRTVVVTKKGHPNIKQFWKEAQARLCVRDQPILSVYHSKKVTVIVFP